MEIQAIEHNVLQVRYNCLEDSTKSPDLTLGSQYSSFRTDLKPSILVRGTFQLIVCSIPPILTIVTIFLQNFVNVYYALSTQDKVIISAFGVGMTFLNLFGYNIMFAFNNNLIALISQAHGARDPYAVGVHFQRGLIFQIPLFCLLIVAIYFAETILTLFGIHMDSHVMEEAQTFVRWSSLSVLFSGIFDVGRIYLCSQNLFKQPFYIKIIGAVINVGLAEMLVGRYNLKGLAIAKNVSEFISIVLLYIWIQRLRLNSWIRPTLTMFSKGWDYFKFIFTGGLALYIHFLYIEVLTIFVGNLNDTTTMSAHISFVNLRPLLFAIPLGTSVSVTSFVGQSVGENAKKKAQTASVMGVIACNIYFVMQMAGGYWLLEPLKQFLSINEENESKEFDVIFNLYVFVIIYLESHQFMFTGIMKGLGQLSHNLKFYFIGFYLVGIPLTYGLGFFKQMKLQGIWMSYLVCNLIVCIFQVLFLTRNNWDTFLGEKQVDLDNDIEIPLIDFTRVNKETEEHHILHEEVVSDGTKIKQYCENTQSHQSSAPHIAQNKQSP